MSNWIKKKGTASASTVLMIFRLLLSYFLLLLKLLPRARQEGGSVSKTLTQIIIICFVLKQLASVLFFEISKCVTSQFHCVHHDSHQICVCSLTFRSAK